jgi:hypothetical protein
MRALQAIVALAALAGLSCQGERGHEAPAAPAERAALPEPRADAERMGAEPAPAESMESMDPMVMDSMQAPPADSMAPSMAAEPPRERPATPPRDGPWVRPAPLDARPTALPWPEPPAPERSQRTPLPVRQPLERNAWVADRFTASGQQATYAFFAEAGELALFELAAYGFERGSGPRLRLAVLDARDELLQETVRGGGVAWRALISFVAPADRSYRLELSARQDPCRFVLARHSDYTPNGAAAIELDGRERLHGQLASAADRALYSLRLAAGEELALELEGTRLEARQEARMLRNEAGGRGGERARRQYAPCVMALTLDGVPIASGTFALVRAERAGLLAIEVRHAEADAAEADGALFDLVLERNPKKVELTGVVVDREDRPLPGVELEFLREPDGEALGRCTTSETGAWTHAVLPGDLTVRLRRAGERGVAEVSTHAAESGELNLLWLPRGPARGRQ